MKYKAGVTFLLFAVALFVATTVLAQADTEPPLGLPLLSSTPTVSATATTAESVTTLITATPTYSLTVVSSQTAVDEAETGPNLIILSILSLIAGIGFFFIKKYFDLKRYSL